MVERPVMVTWRWIVVILWVIAIFVISATGRPMANALREASVLVPVIGFAGLCVIGLVGWKFARLSGDLAWRGGAITLAAALALFLALIAQSPEERFHIVEFGLLAYLMVGALGATRNRVTRWGVAFIISFLIGAADEGWQYWLPNRYFDPLDISLNGMASIVGLAVAAGLREDRR